MTSTIHRHIYARHKTGRIAGQKRNRFGQLFGLTGTAHRMRRPRMLQKFGVRLGIHAAAFVQIRHRYTRINGVAAYALGGQFEGHATRKLIDRRFGQIVRQNARKRADAVHAGHVHDIALASDQMGHRQHCQVVDRAHIGGHDAIVLLEAGAFDCARFEDAGIVDENIELACHKETTTCVLNRLNSIVNEWTLTKFSDRLVDQAFGILLVGHIAGYDQFTGLIADTLLRHALQIGDISASQTETGTEFRQMHSCCRTDARTGARNENDFAGKRGCGCCGHVCDVNVRALR